ncbi:MAG: hypothetical protein LBF88_09640 [Planctomycetaceae bacterium]|jgi:hypothetical protein|nr:hypothetical protein [Planctomycetaceae bacterium]
MATITKLALRISADIGDLTKNAQDVIASVNSIAKVAGNATPSMKNLEDAANGYSIALDAVKKAQDRFSNANGFDQLTEATNIWNEADKAAKTLRDTVERLGQGVANDILNMEPTINNVLKAQKEVQKLKDLKKQLVSQGAEASILDAEIREATENVGTLSMNVAETTIQMEAFKSAIFAIQNVPFSILSSIFSDLLKDVQNWGQSINKTLGDIPMRVTRTIAVLTALLVLLGLCFVKLTAIGISTSYVMALVKSSLIYQGLAGVVTMLGTIITATWGWATAQGTVNNLWTYLLGSTGIGAILIVLGLIVAGLSAIVWWWTSTAETTEEAEENTRRLKQATDDYRESLQKTVQEHENILDYINKIQEASKSPVEKAADRAKQLQDAVNEPKRFPNVPLVPKVSLVPKIWAKGQ